MKNNKIIQSTIFVVMISIFVTACNDKDSITYSCDEHIDNLIKSDITNYSNLSREEWIALPDSLKIPVFRTFSNSKKLEFWREKYNELKSLEWTDKEKRHLETLFGYLYKDINIFDYHKNVSAADLVNEFNDNFSLWYNYCTDSLGWTAPMVFAMIGTGEHYNDVTLKKYGGGLKDILPPLYATNSCDCMYDLWCNIFRYEKCEKRICDKTSFGCGPLLLNECVGICKD